ncbi:ROK family transcriptional regulator [Microbacterium sp. A84]|uniref:ROK family transcriptional regulator n=1 Tax=Microbacterium sp. A84 TaxID=3450715 RepID=UPI003F6E09D9
MAVMNLAAVARAQNAARVLRPTEVRGTNSSVILRLLIENGPMPRAEISTILGLSQGAVTRIVADLAEQGLVEEGASVSANSPGRPRVPVGIIAESRLSVGVHIGVHFIHAALTNLGGEAVESRRIAHDGTPENVIALCAELIDKLRALATAPLLGIGVISGGWVEPETGIIHRHGLLNWRDVPLRAELTRRTGVDVLVETSARAHAVADILYGNAHGHADFAHVFIGHVVEASLVVGGRVHAGPHGLGGALASWVVDDGTGRVSTAGKVVSDGAVIAKAEASGLVPAGSSFEDVLALATESTPESDAATALLHERAYRSGQLTAALTDLVGISLLIFSSGVVSLESSIDHIRAGIEHARPGLPVPEIRTEANLGATLTRAASSVVLTTVL